MAKSTIFVAAPRSKAWDPADKSSPMVLRSRGRRHPANPAYSLPAGEVVIHEGMGVAGDPEGQHDPVEIWPYPDVVAKLRSGALVEVEPDADTSELQIQNDDLASLEGVNKTQRDSLLDRRIDNVTDLAEALRKTDDPVAWLERLDGWGNATANDVIEQLEIRELL